MPEKVFTSRSASWPPHGSQSQPANPPQLQLQLTGDDFEELLKKARAGMTWEVMTAVGENPDLIHRSGINGLGLLHKSCCGGHLELSEKLLDKGADLQVKDKFGEDPLMFASQKGHVAIVKLLLDRGASANTSNLSGWTALGWAASYDRLDVCVLLLSRGANFIAVIHNNISAVVVHSKNASDEIYGRFPYDLSVDVKQQRREMLSAVFASGPHPSQVQRRRQEKWSRRWPWMNVVVGCGFRPLAVQLLELELERIALAAVNGIPPSTPLDTPERRRAYCMGMIFSNEALVRIICAFL